MEPPCEELGDGMRGEDVRAVTVGNALDLRLEILVSDDRDEGLESVTVRGTLEPKPPQVLGLRVAAQYLRKDPLLHRIGILGHLFDELESLRMLQASGWAQRR